MTTISKSFTATGNGAHLAVKHNDSFTYSVSGTFVGTVILEKSTTSGASWETVTTATAEASGTVVSTSTFGNGAWFRFRCSAYTSGTIVTSIADADADIREWMSNDGKVPFKITEAGIEALKGIFTKALVTAQASDVASATTIDLDAAEGNVVDVTGTTTITGVTLAQGSFKFVRFTGALTFTHGASLVLPSAANITTAAGDACILVGYASGVVRCLHYQKASGFPVTFARTSQKYMINAAGVAKVGATAGFTVAAGADTALVTCPQSQTASTLVIPITGLKVGWTITAFHLVGQIESAGGAVTVDADLRKHTAAAADVTDASVGAITQISVTADTAITSANSEKGSLAEVTGADETFYVLITVTTAASTDVAIQGVAVTVTEA